METDSSNDLVQIVVGPFLASTQADPDLVRDFFIVFSRFEYAMKRAGFLKPKQTKAEADWDRLGVCLRASFESRHTPEFESAVQYLTEHPPQKQVVIDGNLSWSPTSCGDRESRSQFVLRLVRIVRNNLFHGGKFPVPYGPIAESARDKKLLQSSLIVLGACSHFEPNLQQWFEVDV